MDEEVVDRAQSSRLLVVEAVVCELPEHSSSQDWYSSSASSLVLLVTFVRCCLK